MFRMPFMLLNNHFLQSSSHLCFKINIFYSPDLCSRCHLCSGSMFRIYVPDLCSRCHLCFKMFLFYVPDTIYALKYTPFYAPDAIYVLKSYFSIVRMPFISKKSIFYVPDSIYVLNIFYVPDAIYVLNKIFPCYGCHLCLEINNFYVPDAIYDLK